MGKRLFVLNVDRSGINQYMYDGLRERGWDVRVWDVPIPKTLKYIAAARSFRFNPNRWKRVFHSSLATMLRSRRGLRRRTDQCSKALERLARPDDIVLTLGIMFDPENLRWEGPYVIFKDYTTALASRGFSDTIPANGSALERWLLQEENLCRHAALVFSASEHTRRSVIQDYGLSEDRVLVVGEGLCFDRIPPPPSQRPAGQEVLFIGKDFRRKGGETVLIAFEGLLKEYPEARLTVVGPERPPTIPKNVRWPGLVTNRSLVREFYRNADIFAMPSLGEPFGLVFLEAMAHGLPCIGSTRDAMPEIIEHERTGFLIKPGDADELRRRICFLFENPEEGQKMGSRGYQRVKSQFQWMHVAERMDRRLTQLLKLES